MDVEVGGYLDAQASKAWLLFEAIHIVGRYSVLENKS